MKKALDLFCGAGGATRGLQLAGFFVHGIDISPQPRYCGNQFTQADALDPMFTYEWFQQFDFIWASPPCQRYSNGAAKWKTSQNHPDLIAPVRELLRKTGKPCVIENIEAARGKLIDPFLLCGTQFDLGVFRHRLFEIFPSMLRITPWERCEDCAEFLCNIHGLHVHDCCCPPIEDWGFIDPYRNQPMRYAVPHLRHAGKIGDGKYMTVTGHSGGSSRRDGWKNGSVEQGRIAMGIDWMTWAEMAEAIPPAYSEFIARSFLGKE